MDESIVALISTDRENVGYTFEDLEEYLRDGGDPNSTSYGGVTILKQATMKGDSRTVELLLEYRADPNLGDTRNRVLRGWRNTPPLFFTKGNVEVTRLLLEGVRGDGWAYDAVSSRGRTTGRVIAVPGIADVNYMTEKYGTPLHRAAQHGYNNVVRLLLEYGADPNRKANVRDPNWDQERDRDPVTGHRIGVINAPQVYVNPEELAILYGHLDTAEIIKNNFIPIKQKLAIARAIEKEDPLLSNLDYDTIQELSRYISRDLHPTMRRRIREEPENQRIADYLDDLDQYGSGKRNRRKRTRKRLYRRY